MLSDGVISLQRSDDLPNLPPEGHDRRETGSEGDFGEMAYEVDLPVRFDDVDAAGVVYYPRILDMCHQAFESLFSARGNTPYHELFLDQKIGFPARSLEVEFLSPVEYRGAITLTLSTSNISTRSVQFHFEGRQGNEVCFRAKVGKVCCQPQVDGRFESVEIPADVRQLLVDLEEPA